MTDDEMREKRGCKKYKQQVFRVKKTRGAPMRRPKLELLASNAVARDFCHAI